MYGGHKGQNRHGFTMRLEPSGLQKRGKCVPGGVFDGRRRMVAESNERARGSRQFRQKSLISMGAFLVFRGNQEHSTLPVNCIQFGTFEEGHDLAGQMYVETKHLLDQSYKLCLSKGRKRDTKRAMCLPVNEDELSCPGGIIFRYSKTLAPNQKRW